MSQVPSNLESILFPMDQVGNIMCGRKEKAETIDENNRYNTVIDCEEVKPIYPISGYGNTVPERRIKYYCSSHKILLFGEGDFSFSACLAKVFGSADNMVATSLDSKDFLQKNYRKAMANINDLKRRGCEVHHEMDATSGHKSLKGMKFDRIVFNFPLAGFFNNESQQSQISRHQNLVTKFFKNAKGMLSREGEIHVSHKSGRFYSEWNIESLASLSGLNFINATEFDLNDYPGYNTKYGFGGDWNFNCYPSKTYMFRLGTSRSSASVIPPDPTAKVSFVSQQIEKDKRERHVPFNKSMIVPGVPRMVDDLDPAEDDFIALSGESDCSIKEDFDGIGIDSELLLQESVFVHSPIMPRLLQSYEGITSYRLMDVASSPYLGPSGIAVRKSTQFHSTPEYFRSM